MGVNFPLVNVRRTITGTWEQNHETAESITVPTSADYEVRLIEVPDDGSQNAKPLIAGLTETVAYPPAAGTFYVNYNTGDIAFNAAEAGNTYNVDYWQKGSLIEADDINYLQSSIASAGGAVDVEDEGVSTVSAATTLNFIGADVVVYINPSDPNQADIYIPALLFQPYFNTSNAQGDATVNNISTSSRNVADPAPENNYDIGAWTPGSAYNSTRTTSLQWTHGATCSFMDDTTTVEVWVYGADDVTPLENYVTPAITGDGVNSGTQIDVTISNWAADSIRYKANIVVDVNINGLIPAGGRWSIKIVHHNAGTDYTYTQGPIFFDTETNAATLTGVTVAETGGGVVTRFISGVEYYDIGSQFTVNIADIDYINSDTYVAASLADVVGTEYGLPGLTLGSGNLTGWANDWNNIDDTYTNTAWAINNLDYFLASTTANVSARTHDWTNGSYVNSANASILVDTYNDTSTALIERFRFENWRCPTSGDFDLANQKSWTSSSDVGLGDAVFYNGGCERNVTNFTIYNPNSGTQPNYTTQNATVYLIREFNHTGAASAGFDITISGTYASLEYKLAAAWTGLPDGGTVWVDMTAAYNAGQWNNGNPLGGTGSLTGGTHHSCGTNNLINCNDTLYLRVSFTAGQRITSLSVSFD